MTQLEKLFGQLERLREEGLGTGMSRGARDIGAHVVGLKGTSKSSRNICHKGLRTCGSLFAAVTDFCSRIRASTRESHIAWKKGTRMMTVNKGGLN